MSIVADILISALLVIGGAFAGLTGLAEIRLRLVGPNGNGVHLRGSK